MSQDPAPPDIRWEERREVSPDTAWTGHFLYLPIRACAESLLAAILGRIPDSNRTHWVLPRGLLPAATLADLLPGQEVPHLAPAPLGRSIPRPEGLTLRPAQQEAVEALKKHPLGGVVQIACAGGKTVLGLYVGSTLPGATLVVCTQHAHLLNWASEARERFGLDDRDILFLRGSMALFPEAREGRAPCLILVTVQSLNQIARRAPTLLGVISRHIGLAIYDETHHMAAATWHPFTAICAHVRLGLSATPARIDREEEVYKAGIGPVIYANLAQDMIPSVHVLDVPVFLGKAEGPENAAEREGWLAKHPALLREAKALLQRLRGEGRTIYVVSRSTEVARVRALFPGEVGVITGETPADERLHQLHSFPIVAVTAGVGQENYNRTDLDTLVFLTAPKAYAHAAPLVQQAVGRIQREKEGKKPPQVWLLRAVGVPESVVHVGTILRWAKAQGYRVFRPTPIKAAIKAAEAARGA